MRQKTVFSYSDLLHRFANRGCNNGDRTSSHNLFVEGSVLYSYGFHFPLARWDRGCIFINSRKTSKTTNKHRIRLWYNLPDGTRAFRVANVLNPEMNHQELVNNLVDRISGVLSGRKYYTMSGIFKFLNDLNQYEELFNLNKTSLDQEFLETLAELDRATASRFAAISRKQAEQKAIEHARKVEENREQIAAWLVGKLPTCYGLSSYSSYDHDLVRVYGGEIQTLRGVNLDLNIGISAYRALKAGQLSVGTKLDCYEVTEIGPEFIQIGCHKLSRKQLDEVFSEYIK